MANQKLEKLRKLMNAKNVDVYVVPTADFHESEYVGSYFAARKFLTGFTGSAGIAVVTKDKAGLWTDGRYFIQAEKELADSDFTLYRSGEKGVPTVNEFIAAELPIGGAIGFDGRVVNAAWGREMQKIAEEKRGSLSVTEDLVGQIWTDRPALARGMVWILPEEFTGESTRTKLTRIRQEMDRLGAAVHVVTSLDDIAWILNLRGNDAGHFHVILSYLMITKKGCVFYVNQSRILPEIQEYLAKNGVTLANYEEIYQMADMLSQKSVGKILLDTKAVNFRLVSAISAANELLDLPNPSVKMKAVKNVTELMNIRKAHVKDGVAMVRWLKWLKESVGKTELTEVSVAEKLAQYRQDQENFVDLSFDTIAAYEANGAMMHYSATPEKCAVIEPKGFLLVDSGGHYLEGSTDITRTIVMGPITDEQRQLFTAVLRGNLNLAAARFLYGCSGQNLDILARGPLWEMGIDYKCGTGHGVGYILGIHEAPNGFRWKIVPERQDSAVLEAGMVTTDEPGVYIEGRFGIRTENELIVRKDEENEYGQFMSFETVTYCPIDLEAVDVTLLSEREKLLLNSYHKMVYRILSPHLSYEEKLWLRYETREV